jgi:ribosomal protein S18 acetylase RimI-like enzyme
MFNIRPMRLTDLLKVKDFTDREIGRDYYSSQELDDMFRRSEKNGIVCSLILENEGEIHGIRLSYPPGQWQKGKGKALNSEKWPHSIEETAYFQSLFLSSAVQGQGWGGRLSEAALERLRLTGAKGVVCHSWKESPNNSSTKYLKKLNFKSVGEHPQYWSDLDYQCTRCGNPPCQCTAEEMYLDLGITGRGK